MSRWTIWTAAPHRVMFLGGTVQLVLTMLYWAVELSARQFGHSALALPGVPVTALHGFLMIYGLVPFFIFGFLMTTYPRWMNGPLVPRSSYLAAFMALAGGLLLVYAAAWFGRAALIVGVLLVMVGFAIASVALWRVYRLAPAQDKHYERHINVALSAALLGQGCYLAWLVVGGMWLGVALGIGLWLFLVPLLVTVGHRMIPFFSINALDGYRAVHPPWSLPLLWIAAVGHLACDLLGYGSWRLLPDALLFAVALHLTWSWRLPASLRVRLLAVLHIAFAGLAFGMALFVIQDLGLLLYGQAWLGRAPLHVLGIGFVAALALGMATRVTLGHSGRELQMDSYSWYCFVGIELAMGLRVIAELPWSGPLVVNGLSLLAAVAWLVAVTFWAARYAPMFLRRRVDGQSG